MAPGAPLAAQSASHTRDEAVAWARSMVDQHWAIKDDSHWTQCVGFIWQRCEYLGQGCVDGDACDYRFSFCRRA